VCGIAGFEIHDRNSEATAARLIADLTRRGPDGAWVARYGSLVVVQTRLAVIDLSPGVTYPMTNEAGNVHLAFNGEIYDHTVLRRELEKKGHRFSTACDAEVVLHGYEEWGIDLFPRLNGMFAVALADESRDQVVLTRDRFGIKPLAYTRRAPFAFSSDAISLVDAGLARRELDRDAIADFAVLHYVPPPQTGLTDVHQVVPGVAITRRGDGTHAEVQWAEGLPETKQRPVTAEAADSALQAAVSRQLVADVDVGVFLSGGLDSALVLSAAVRGGARPKAFSISFPGQGDYDEAPAAAAVARRLGVPHQIFDFEMSFSEAVDRASAASDGPFADASILPMLQLAEQTRPHVTVALSGTGGDDLFGGYYRHRAHLLGPILDRLPRRLARWLQELEPQQGTARKGRLRLARSYAARLAKTAGQSKLERYLALIDQLGGGEKVWSFRVDPDQVLRSLADRFELGEALAPTPLRAVRRFELQTYLPGDLLTKEDRATMAVGLEARVPLLDDALATLAAQAPDDQLVSLRHGKRLLRAVAKRHGLSVPMAKRGFAVPIGTYFAGQWRTEAREWLSGAESDLVDRAAGALLLDQERPPATDIWALASLVAWERRVRTAGPGRDHARLDERTIAVQN
jgi:asparagine synthase (glutamine-hydrolysing)